MEKPESKKVAMKLMYDPPGIIKKCLPGMIWSSKTDKVLLTFDDGPVPGNTERILKQLDETGIKALFFCVGNNIRKNPELAGEIISQGHMIGNHTFNHRILLNIPGELLLKEINDFNRVFEDTTGLECSYLRPPHGRFGPALLKYLKTVRLKCVMWSLLTWDYKNNLNIVKFAAGKYLKRDSIIVLHDSMKSGSIITDAVKYIHEEVKGRGYEFGDPAECLK